MRRQQRRRRDAGVCRSLGEVRDAGALVHVARVVLEDVGARVDPVGVFGEDAPAISRQRVGIHDPVVGFPFLALAALIADDGDAGAVVAGASVPADHDVRRRAEHEHDAGMAVLGKVRRVVVALGIAIERGFVAVQNRAVRAAHPEAVAAVVGLVAVERVARRPALEAIVVGIRAVVLLEVIAGADPVVERADEDAVAAVRAGILREEVAIRAGLDEDAGRIAGMDLAGFDADSVVELVIADAIVAGMPELEAGVGTVGEIVAAESVPVRMIENATVPDAVGLAVFDRGLVNMDEQNAAAPPVLPHPNSGSWKLSEKLQPSIVHFLPSSIRRPVSKPRTLTFFNVTPDTPFASMPMPL